MTLSGWYTYYRAPCQLTCWKHVGRLHRERDGMAFSGISIEVVTINNKSFFRSVFTNTDSPSSVIATYISPSDSSTLGELGCTQSILPPVAACHFSPHLSRNARAFCGEMEKMAGTGLQMLHQWIKDAPSFHSKRDSGKRCCCVRLKTSHEDQDRRTGILSNITVDNVHPDAGYDPKAYPIFSNINFINIHGQGVPVCQSDMEEVKGFSIMLVTYLGTRYRFIHSSECVSVCAHIPSMGLSLLEL
ncbi:hypothetical protein C5167_042450, partial [Papaver somniferum]